MVMPKEILSADDFLVLKVDQFPPEGYAHHRFQFDNLDFPLVECLQEDTMVVWDIQSTIPPLGALVWIMGVSELDEIEHLEGFQFQTEPDVFWSPILERQRSPPCVRLLELCAGGYGGRKGATTLLQEHCEQKFQTVAVEIDLHACLSYAVAHSATLCQVPELHHALLHQPDNDLIVCAAIMNTQWWQAACRWNPHIISISSSCNK